MRERSRVARMMAVTVVVGGLWAALSLGAGEPPAAFQVSYLASPDGKLLAFAMPKKDAPDGQATSIMVCNFDGSGRREIKLLAGPCEGLAWFGNGRLVYTPNAPRSMYGYRPQSECGYKVIALDGKELPDIRLPAGCDVLYKILSPDGRYVAFVGRYTPDGQERQFGLFVVKLEGGQIRRLLDEAVKTAPAWSPDSKKLAIGNAAGYVQQYPLVIIDVENGHVTATGSDGVGVAWSPDGRLLACSAEVARGGSWMQGVPMDGRLGVLDVQSKTMKLLTPPGHNLTTADRGMRVWQIGGSLNPTWSPDGHWIAYWRSVSCRAGRANKEGSAMWIVNREGTQFHKAFAGRQTVAWSADSKWLISIKEGNIERVELARLPAVDAAAEYAKRPILDAAAIAANPPPYSAAQARGKWSVENQDQIPPPRVNIPDNALRLSYLADVDKRSLGGSGHAIAFARPAAAKAVMAVAIYASRYGLPQPPKEDFHVYLLDEEQNVIKDVRFPYGMISRGEMQWYTFPMPPTKVPQRFFVALSFNPHQTKGIYLGLDKNVKETHSYIGLPGSGFKKVDQRYDWMVQVYLVP